MASSSMSMSMGPSATMSMAAASSSTTGSSGDMSDMTMGGCKISMTWNWYTVGACFISQKWQVTSSGMFAGSCIGVICLVVTLEFLRRLQREYNALVRRQDLRKIAEGSLSQDGGSESAFENCDNSAGKQASTNVQSRPVQSENGVPTKRRASRGRTLLQRQLIRSLLHMLQFGVAYFIMLLAMYYNGYIIISILIGAFFGEFIFSWDQLLIERGQNQEPADVTGCCG